MLIIEAAHDDNAQRILKGQRFQLYIVDSHHHLGREKEHSNTPNKVYDFYQMLYSEFLKKVEEKKDQLKFVPVDVQPAKHPEVFFNINDSWIKSKSSWFVDRTVVFPYNDLYAKKDFPEQPSFRVSNNKIYSWTTRIPHSLRLIGFARVDPTDAVKSDDPDMAVKELERAIIELGLRGLKLHPLSQKFVSEITSDFTVKVVERAAELDIPIIFDTRGIEIVRRIYDLVNIVLENRPDLSRNLRVILAHCAFDPAAEFLYEALSHPNIYADVAGMHDRDVPLLFRNAVDLIASPTQKWSEKFLWGTDYTFLTVQAIDVLTYMLSDEFEGTLTDIQRILAGNVIQLVNRPIRVPRKDKIKTKGVYIDLKTEMGIEKDISLMLANEIISKYKEDKIQVLSFDYFIPPKSTWTKVTPLNLEEQLPPYTSDFIIALKSDEKYGYLLFRSWANEVKTVSILNAEDWQNWENLELSQQKYSKGFMKIMSNTTQVHEITEIIDLINEIISKEKTTE